MRSLCLLLLLAAPAFAQPAKETAEPSKAAPSVASITARRAKIAALLKKTEAEVAALVKEDAAEVAALNKLLKSLNLATTIEPLALLRKPGAPGPPGKPGAPGPAGKDGRSPVIAWGTGADFDRLTIDGVASGPHLTGPKGGPAAPIPKAKAAHLTFVYPNAATAGVVNDVGLRTWLKERGVKAHVIVTNGELPDGFAEALNAVGVPCVIVQDMDGKRLASAPLTTVEAIKELIK